MKVLITGGAGYLGANLVDLLQSNKIDCLIYDNFSSSKKSYIEGFNFIEADILNEKSLDECFASYQPDIIVHLASIATVGEGEQDPEHCNKVNILGTKLVLDAMQKHGIRKIVFASSAAVYAPSPSPIREEAAKIPANVYGSSKLEGEKLIQSYGENDNSLDAVIFRIFNLAGAHKKIKFGELHEPETHLVPLAIEATYKAIEMKIYGDDYQTEDGTAIRDYIHITDAANAIYLACRHLQNSKGVKILNLGSGTGSSVKEVINKTSKTVGRRTKFRIESRRQGDEATLVADNTKLRNLLGWQPECSNLDNIIQTAFNWYLVNEK